MSGYRRETHVNLTFELEPRDVADVMEQWAPAHMKRRRAAVLATFTLACASFALTMTPVVGTVAILAGLGLVVRSLLAKGRFDPVAMHGDRWEALRRICLEADGRGLRVDDGLTERWYAWPALSGWGEGQKSLCICVDDTHIHTIPARVFADESQRVALRRLFDEHLGPARQLGTSEISSGRWRGQLLGGVLGQLFGLAVIEAVGRFASMP